MNLIRLCFCLLLLNLFCLQAAYVSDDLLQQIQKGNSDVRIIDGHSKKKKRSPKGTRSPRATRPPKRIRIRSPRKQKSPRKRRFSPRKEAQREPSSDGYSKQYLRQSLNISFKRESINAYIVNPHRDLKKLELLLGFALEIGAYEMVLKLLKIAKEHQIKLNKELEEKLKLYLQEKQQEFVSEFNEQISYYAPKIRELNQAINDLGGSSMNVKLLKSTNEGIELLQGLQIQKYPSK